MVTTKMGDDNCPTCNAVINSSTAIGEDAVPVPGDLSICFECGEYLYFESDMNLGVLPDLLFHEQDNETRYQLIKARKLIRMRCKS